MSNPPPRRSRQEATPRFVKNPHPEPRAPSRSAKGRARRSRTPAVEPVTESHRGRRRAQRLPGWKELSDANSRPDRGRPAHLTLLDAIPTFRMALVILTAAAVITLYVGHVLATQELMTRAESLRRENLALHLRFNRVKGAFDLASGPAVIYERARALGLTEQVPNGPAIELD